MISVLSRSGQLNEVERVNLSSATEPQSRLKVSTEAIR